MNPSQASLTPQDRAFLHQARTLARQGWGRVHPNPMVGCLVVRAGRVVGEGAHRDFGGPHAEVVALGAAGGEAAGATAYVSLEPCDHQGKTPPCTQALIAAGVTRVVYGAADPTAEAAGGHGTLEAAGVEVVGPVWDREEASSENAGFFHNARYQHPFLALKLALTLDARIAASLSGPTRITGPEAQESVHDLRRGFDAILVGGGTARSDDPQLTIRHGDVPEKPPARLILDSRAGLASDAALLEEAPHVPLHVFTSRTADEGEMERLEAAGAHIHPVGDDPHGRGLDLSEVLADAWELGLRRILCEGGAKLAASLLAEDRVHRLYLYVAPRVLGEGVPGFDPEAAKAPWARFHPACAPELLGRDLLHVLDRRED